MRCPAELRLDVVQAVALLGLPEPALDLVAFVELLFPFPLFVYGLLGPSPFRDDGHPDAPFPAPVTVGVGPVDLVGLYEFRVMAVEFPVGLGVGHKVGTLVVGVPAQGPGLGEAVRPGKAHLGAELDLLARLAPYYRPDVGLGDAHDPVVAPIGPVGVHFPLLGVDGLYHPKVPHHFMGQGIFLQQVEHRVDAALVAVQTVQVVADRAPERLFVGLSLFRFGKVFLPCDLPIGPGLDLEFAAQVLEQKVYDGLRPFPGLIEQPQVVGVRYVLVGHGGVELELALVLRILRPDPLAVADGGQYVREPVEGIVAEPLPPFHEQGGREDLGRRELAKP